MGKVASTASESTSKKSGKRTSGGANSVWMKALTKAIRELNILTPEGYEKLRVAYIMNVLALKKSGDPTDEILLRHAGEILTDMRSEDDSELSEVPTASVKEVVSETPPVETPSGQDTSGMTNEEMLDLVSGIDDAPSQEGSESDAGDFIYDDEPELESSLTRKGGPLDKVAEEWVKLKAVGHPFVRVFEDGGQKYLAVGRADIDTGDKFISFNATPLGMEGVKKLTDAGPSVLVYDKTGRAVRAEKYTPGGNKFVVQVLKPIKGFKIRFWVNMREKNGVRKDHPKGVFRMEFNGEKWSPLQNASI